MTVFRKFEVCASYEISVVKSPPSPSRKTLAVIAGHTMKIFGHILILGLISIIVQTFEQIALERTTSFEYLQETRHGFIISTMFVFIICIYFILRRWNNKTRPPFLKSLTIIFFVQILTILSLTAINIAPTFFSIESDFLPDTTAIAIQFDPSDFIAKTLIFAFGLPLIILTPLYLLDRQKKQSNYS